MQTNEELVNLIKTGIDVNDNMIKLWNNLEALIYNISKRYVNTYFGIEDLMQESFIAIYDILEFYNQEQSKFSTFVCFCLKRHLFRYTHENSLFFSPGYMESIILRYKRYFTDYIRDNAMKPSDIQIVKDLNIDIQTLKIIKMTENNSNIASLDVPIGDDDNSNMLEIIGNNDFEDNTIRSIDSKECLEECMNNLDNDEKNIIECHYVKKMSLQQTGEQLNISVNEVKKIVYNTKNRLLKIEKIRNYYNDYLAAQSYHHVSVATFNSTWSSITERVALNI